MSRCCPIVVPVLPPTGVAGVGSLKPTPAAVALMTVMVALPEAEAAARSAPRIASAMPRVVRATLLLLRAIRRRGRRLSAARDALELRRAVGLALRDHGGEKRVAEIHDLRPVGSHDRR